MAARIQIRRDFSANWTLNNPILTEGELGYELDTRKLKVGDGVRAWNSLNYFQETVNYTDVVDPPRNLSYFTDDVGYLLESSPAGSISNANISNWNTAYGWGNHAVAGYLTTSNAATTYLSITNAASSYQPLDGDLTSISGLSGTSGLLRKTAANTWTLDTTNYLTTADAAGGVSVLDIQNWNDAYSWGDHADAGYLTIADAQTQYQPFDADLTAIGNLTSTGLLRRTGANTWTLDSSVYLTSETDPVFAASPASTITSGLINNWNTAFSWGNHASAGYQAGDADLTAIAALAGTSGLLRKTAANTWTLDTNEYLTSADAAGGISGTLISNWNDAYSWGDHALEGYLLASTASTTYQPLDADLTAIAGISSNAGLLRKTGSNTWTLDTNTYLTGETDPTVGAHIKGITVSNINNWNSAFSWGDHGVEGYARVVGAPATSGSTGTAGTIAYDSQYFYVCRATNTWERVAWDSTPW